MSGTAYIRYPQTGGGGGSGTVTSVGLSAPASVFTVSGSPVTTSGILSLGLQTQTANTVWSGPSSGSASTPTFRALVAADIPALPYSPQALTNTHIFVGNASNVATDVAVSGDATITNAGVLTISNGAITNAKVDATAAIAYSKLNLTGAIVNADISSSAAIAYSKLNLTGDIVNADISASAAIAFSKLASLTSAHILVGSAGNVATDVDVSGDISLTNAGVTAYSGVVPANKGGTGIANNSASTLTISGSFGTTLTVSGTTTATLQQTNGVLVGRSTTDTLTNKTLTTPIINGVEWSVSAVKTSNYTVLVTDNIVIGNSSGGTFTFTLPAATTGLQFSIQKALADTSFTSISISGTGLSTTLNTSGERVTVFSDGSNWFVLDRYIPSISTSYTPTTVGTGTISQLSAWWKREGNHLYVYGAFKCGTVSASTFSVSIPSGLNIDTTVITSTANVQNVGLLYDITNSGTPSAMSSDQFPVFFDGSSTTTLFVATTTQSNTLVKQAGNILFNSNDSCGFNFKIPISGWNG